MLLSHLLQQFSKALRLRLMMNQHSPQSGTIPTPETEQQTRQTMQRTDFAGIDVFLIAPMDLAASLGHVGNRDHPDVQSAIARAEQAILGADRPMGGLCLSAEEGNEKIAKGYQVILMGHDLSRWTRVRVMLSR